jgi:chitosanase
VNALTDVQSLTCRAIVRVFETGRPNGGYASIGRIKGDTGGLSYGICQVTRASGALCDLVQRYIRAHGRHASELAKFLSALLKRDPSLDRDARFEALLRQASEDPVMRQAQEMTYAERFWLPAANYAERLGCTRALSFAVMLDSTVHGSRSHIVAATEKYAGRLAQKGEQAWIREYVVKRDRWLRTHGRRDLRATVYRTESFLALVDAGNWDLRLPLAVRCGRNAVPVSAEHLAVSA